MNYIIAKDKSKSELVQYLLATSFSPSLSTFIYAINNGNFVIWPGIFELNFKKLLGTTISIEKGYMDQERKNLRSTSNEDEHTGFPPTQIRIKVYNLFASIKEDIFTPKEKAYSDQTGRFPHKSTHGNQYIFTLYDYDGNTILAEPLKPRQGKVIATAATKFYEQLTKHVHAVQLFVLDNECSNDLKLAILSTDVKFELVPPHQHRRNAAERAICIYKNHLLAGLATCDPDCPVEEWDRLLFQCELTLNLLRTSRINPKLSS